jgi:hypothetical protein
MKYGNDKCNSNVQCEDSMMREFLVFTLLLHRIKAAVETTVEASISLPSLLLMEMGPHA